MKRPLTGLAVAYAAGIWDLSTTSKVHIRVLNPPPGVVASRSEDNALVLAVEFGPTRVL
jgi:hypothetical protein